MNCDSLEIMPQIRDAVWQMGFTELTEIQEKAIPLMLQGRDLVGQAPTGTGKTCAYGIPIIQQLDSGARKPQALILCPTRELCIQITEELGRLAVNLPDVRIVSLYGGQPIEKQIKKLREGAAILVATPGRMQDHMDRRTVDVSGVSTVILDEADEMLNMGFYRDVMKIVGAMRARKHLHMFSATISREVMDISWKYQHNPEQITVAPVEESMPPIKQYSILTTSRNRLADMTEVMIRCSYRRAMVFCDTKYATEALCSQLIGLNFRAECLNGDMQQSERNRIMQKFRDGGVDVLVATDVAARGIDVSGVQVVFNYDLPQSNEYYLHRIGRTGRAGRNGVSFLLYTAEDVKKVREMIRYTQSDVEDVRVRDGKLIPVEPNPWKSGGLKILFQN